MVRRACSALVAVLVAISLLPSVARADGDLVHDFIAVNTETYNFADPVPAQFAFATVAHWRGWSDADVAGWTPFVTTIMGRESGFCPNVRRGVRFADGGRGCAIARQGRFTDSGFGQVLMSVNGRWLCAQEGLCTPDDVIATPWNSMTALVALIERSGASPWCYTAKLRLRWECRHHP